MKEVSVVIVAGKQSILSSVLNLRQKPAITGSLTVMKLLLLVIMYIFESV